MPKSRIKVIVSAHVIEVYEAEQPFDYGAKLHKKIYGEFENQEYMDEETGELKTKAVFKEQEITNEAFLCALNNMMDKEPPDKLKPIKHDSASRRAKNEFRRLCLANFTEGSKFVTLTFNDWAKFGDGTKIDIRSVEQCNKAFKQFIQRLRERYKDFKYINCIEFQDKNKRGAVHYHFIADLPYVKQDKLAELWGNGFVGINYIDNCDNIGAYMTKYMTKAHGDIRLQNKKTYTSSKNLVRPVVLYGKEAYQIIQEYLENKKETFTNSYPSEYLGKITYKEYNLKRIEKEASQEKELVYN